MRHLVGTVAAVNLIHNLVFKMEYGFARIAFDADNQIMATPINDADVNRINNSPMAGGLPQWRHLAIPRVA